jgi:predicted nucleic acid-binding protein
MRTLVADTSVAIAWYLPEAFSDTARRWQQELVAGRIRLIVPSLHFWEFCNVLRTYVRRGEIDPELATEIYAAHLEAPLEVRDPSPAPLLRQALEWEASAYDAVFLALALELDVQLLTAERSTTPWVVRLADRIELVR